MWVTWCCVWYQFAFHFHFCQFCLFLLLLLYVSLPLFAVMFMRAVIPVVLMSYFGFFNFSCPLFVLFFPETVLCPWSCTFIGMFELRRKPASRAPHGVLEYFCCLCLFFVTNMNKPVMKYSGTTSNDQIKLMEPPLMIRWSSWDCQSNLFWTNCCLWRMKNARKWYSGKI